MPNPFDPSALARYGGLTLVARGLVEGFLSGVHKSPYKGYSVEFAEHRQYYPGDDLRRLDWRAAAKTDRYYIKEYEEETNLKAHLLVDASGSMGYGGKSPAKLDYARRVAASLAYLMLCQRDAVGLATLDTRVRSVLPPLSASKHLLQIIRVLEQTQPGGETALAPLLDDLAAHHLKRRGLVILVTDAFDQLDPLTRALRHFRHKRHEVLLLQILAPEEVEFPFTKATRFVDLEGVARPIAADPGRLKRDYLTAFQTFCCDLRERARQNGVDYLMLRTDDPVDRALGAYLDRRHRTRRR